MPYNQQDMITTKMLQSDYKNINVVKISPIIDFVPVL
jgi:hypothetical protein